MWIWTTVGYAALPLPFCRSKILCEHQLREPFSRKCHGLASLQRNVYKEMLTVVTDLKQKRLYIHEQPQSNWKGRQETKVKPQPSGLGSLNYSSVKSYFLCTFSDATKESLRDLSPHRRSLHSYTFYEPYILPQNWQITSFIIITLVALLCVTQHGFYFTSFISDRPAKTLFLQAFEITS